MKILDLARDMIRLCGLSTDDIRIEFTGLRPGEKLFEELLADSESTLPTPHPKLRIAKARTVQEAEVVALFQWVSSDSTMQDDAVRDGLRQRIPEYDPAANGH